MQLWTPVLVYLIHNIFYGCYAFCMAKRGFRVAQSYSGGHPKALNRGSE